MQNKINLIKPFIKFDEVSEELESIFDSGQFTKGAHVEQFIKELKLYTGARHAFLTTSATTALSLCLKALNVSKGDKVAIADFSFPATVNVVEDLGVKPVFIDVKLNTFNMSVDDLRSKIDSSFRAVIFVDVFGNPEGLKDIKQVCEEFDVPLIEDAACALGSSLEDTMIGSISDYTCFSFHPRKLLTTGEGGAILTNSADSANWFRVKLNHGADGMRGKGLDFVDFGYNYRMSEIQALLGWKQLLKLDSVISNRNNIANKYEKGLTPLGFKRQHHGDGVHHNIQSLVFTVPDNISRDGLIDYLRINNIESTLGTYCLSATTFNKKKYDDVQPNAKWLEESTITLPCFDNVDVIWIIDKIKIYLSM